MGQLSFKYDSAKDRPAAKSNPYHVCCVCGKTFHAGIEPSYFVYRDINNPEHPSGDYSGDNLCSWVDSKRCAQLWIMQRM